MHLTPGDCERILQELQRQVCPWGSIVFPIVNDCSDWQDGRFKSRFRALVRTLWPSRRPLVKVRNGAGVWFLGDYRDLETSFWFHHQGHNRHVIRTLADAYRRRPGTILDVGANLCVLSLTLEKELGEGDDPIIAIEPIPSTVERAAAALALNRSRRIRLIPVAIGEMNDELEMCYTPNQTGLSNARAKIGGAMPADSHAVKVPCLTLDALSEQYPLGKVSVLKIDVEGFEPQVIKGARGFIATHRPTILFEYAPLDPENATWTASDVASMISETVDYRYSVLHGNGSVTEFPPPVGSREYLDILCEPISP